MRLSAALTLFLMLSLVGCGQSAERPAGTGTSAAGKAAAIQDTPRRVTILYTGYGRGTVDPQATCT